MTTATQRSLYEILGVSKSATQEELRKAYLKLAHKYHPDKTGGNKAAEEKLKEINGAYDTLKNPEKRKAYDEAAAGPEPFGSGEGFSRGAGFGGFDFGAGDGSGTSFDDILGSIFGGAGETRRYAAPRRGKDLETKVNLSIEEVNTGVSRTLKVRRWDACDACRGTGCAPGHAPEACPDCQGTGQVRRAQGAFAVSMPCAHCGGRGQVNAHPCAACSGKGRVHKRRELSVKVPAGAATGTRLRLSGEGEAGENAGPAGDLYVHIEVAPHAVFEREGNDLVCEVPISLCQATLGTKVHVPTLNGTAELNVPEGAQHGTRLRMRGLGLPEFGAPGRRGDEIVRITLETPTKLSKKQRELLAQFEASTGEHNYPRCHAFRNRMKGRSRVA